MSVPLPKKASQELKERLFKKALEEFSQINAQNIKEQGQPPVLQSINEKLYQKPSLFQTENNSSQGVFPFFLHYIQSSFLHISTIDGILNMFLKKYGQRFNLSPDFQLFQGETSGKLFDSLAEKFVFNKNLSLLRQIPYPFLKEIFLFYFKCRLKYGGVSFYSEKDFEEFNKNEDKSKNVFVKDETSFQFSHFVPLFEEFRQAGEELFLNFMEKKKNKALLDMDDLLLFSLTLLRESPQTAKDFSREWDYWLIDEYQDTSWLQEQIIEKITGFKNVFCVGDPGQSIYLFRGADPDVFKRREKALNGSVKTLNANHRSVGSLVHFYNDFFPANREFIKFSPASYQQIDLENPCVYFFTYEKSNKSQSLVALNDYIQKLITTGSHYNEIAILSSKNETLMKVAAYLRSENIPLMLYSTSFANKRLILDALFLLKFLINPFDNTNLKALLRTPYFYLSDQELAGSSYKHMEFCKNSGFISFWSFIEEYFSNRIFVKSLKAYLKLVSERGLIKTFEKALLSSGFMELSYFHDPTGSSEANLWKLISLLNKNEASALKLFYSFFDEDHGENRQEAPACENDKAIEMMTIHKSKGLEFKHVIIVDFSINQSSLKSKQGKEDIVYDKERGRMAFFCSCGWKGWI